ncbi:hypothetical protein HYN56_22445 [Flavobacterium crocinum]|uniref:Uncharacterized protein n=1 Tax=Flavobacterium crocinum TaxID=2183896 RepID=A0A2S1YF95_9FLAO|nr:hypothetical protein HYN56_00130 [Flavobacterium crocinum]AWK06837.1 hypothetical protein HYN56_22445 [Flavobacterium crocinum]
MFWEGIRKQKGKNSASQRLFEIKNSVKESFVSWCLRGKTDQRTAKQGKTPQEKKKLQDVNKPLPAS